jgi:hypothetical protein
MSPAVRTLNTAVAWGTLVLAVLGLTSLLFSSFVPSAFTVSFAKGGALIAALFYGLFFLGIGRFGWNRRNPRLVEMMRNKRVLASAWFRVPFMACVMGGMAWTGFSSGLPWALNAVFGKAGSTDIVIDGWENSHLAGKFSRQCARPTAAGVPFMMLGRNALCVGSKQTAADFPVGAKMTLYGQLSVFGIDPARYRCCSR